MEKSTSSVLPKGTVASLNQVRTSRRDILILANPNIPVVVRSTLNMCH
jgi:hypothetical protein